MILRTRPLLSAALLGILGDTLKAALILAVIACVVVILNVIEAWNREMALLTIGATGTVLLLLLERIFSHFRDCVAAVGRLIKRRQVNLPVGDVIAVLSAQKKREAGIASRALSVTAVLSALSFYVYGSPSISMTAMIIILIALFGLKLSLLAFDYRVSRGLYGTNEYEAREIVRFILRSKDHNKLGGGLGEHSLVIGEELEVAANEFWGRATT
jgi:hypothetical protein